MAIQAIKSNHIQCEMSNQKSYKIHNPKVSIELGKIKKKRYICMLSFSGCRRCQSVFGRQ